MNVTGELRYYLGGEYATLRYSESRSSLSIDIVLVPGPHRGQGVGSALIARVLLLADLTRRPVFVDARPIGTSSEAALHRLVAYYQRFGFVETGQGLTVVHMRRPVPAASSVVTELALQALRGTVGPSENPPVAA
jgi:GNAT superfamily N-acetyltransferase